MPNKTLSTKNFTTQISQRLKIVVQTKLLQQNHSTDKSTVSIYCRQKSVWSGAGKKYVYTTPPTPYHSSMSHTIHTTPRSYYKTTTRLLHVVAIRHTKNVNREQKKSHLPRI